MKPIMKFLSYIALAMTIVPAFLAMGGIIDDATYKTWMLAGTIGWFVTAPLWIFDKKEDETI
ncbi:hypothetical protein [Tamlana sp. I1]|uniref:hypothetical protein n=1 Tax=Tamlana sp. I1 TaxID=2762061 RepID=UPI00188F8CFC|nr:hypothetical protein [Tamlana sp. I1]